MGMSITKMDQTLDSVTKNKKSVNSHAAQALIRNLLDGNGHAESADPSQATLRLMNGVCDVAESGALLMPGTGRGAPDLESGGGHGHEDEDGLEMGLDNVHRLDMTMEGGEDNGHDNDDDNDNDDDHGFNGYDDGDDDDHDNGAGFVLHSPAPKENEAANEIVTEATLAHGNGNGTGTGTGTAQAKHHSEVLTLSAETKETSPWDMLDPHNDSETKSRPLKVGITFRLPHGCSEPPSASVTGARTKKIPRAKPFEEESIDYGMSYTSLAVQDYKATLLAIEEAKNRNANDDDDSDSENENENAMDTSTDTQTETTHRKMMVPLPMNVLAFGDEFLYVAKAQAKRKAAEKRKLKRMQTENRHESKNAAIANERFEDMYDDDDDENDGNAFNFAGGDDYSAGDGGDDDMDAASRHSARVDGFSGVFGSDDSSDEHQTFEALCRAHLKEFAKGAERFAVETQLSRRVSNWQSKLEGVLAEEDERPEFNIQTYSNRIITSAEMGLQKQKLSAGNNMVSSKRSSERLHSMA